MAKTIPGLKTSRWYKPERRPARTKGVLNGQAPVGCPDANNKEIAMAIFSICESADVVIGRGGEYDKLRDEYTVVGKSKVTGKAQDFKFPGLAVAALILWMRAVHNGQPFDQMALMKKLTQAPTAA